MILFSAKKLIKAWNDNLLHESERVKYLIVSAVWITAGYYLPKHGSEFVWINRLEFSLSVLIAFLGFFWVYRKNGGQKGMHIIEKFVIFSIPSAMRALGLSFIIVFFWTLLNEWFVSVYGSSLTLNFAMDVVYLVLINLTQVVYYGLLGSYVSQLRSES